MLGCSAPAQPNILLISIDTLRADHLEAWGYARATSPAISRLADEGIRFAQAIAQAPWTLPSMATLHTSLYPSEHGAVDANSRLDPRHTTLAEALRGAGYHTLGVTSHVFVGRKRGFAKGFDVFDESHVAPHDATTSPELTATALELLGARGEADAGKPFFLWVHYFDPHYTYVRHEEIGFAGTKGSRPHVPLVINYLRLAARNLDSAGRSRLRPEHVEYIREVYDEEIAYTDAAVAELLEGVVGRDPRRPTVVFLTADHGEFFMERGSLGHEDPVVYQPLVHVPLIIGGGISAELRGRVVEAPVEVASVSRTIAALAGIAAHPFRGSDLLEVAKDRDAAGVAYTESSSAWQRHDRIVAVVAGDWKLIHNRTLDTHELYRLSTDPEERLNRWNDGDAEAAAAGEPLKELLGAFQPRRSEPTALPELSGEEREHLRSLGYLE
jgi:arylsulfatase A-like enzyme